MARFDSNKAAPTTQKLRGGYYTPAALAAFLAKWAVRSGGERVLEPSAGDGALCVPVAQRLLPSGSITAVELLEAELTLAKRRLSGAAAQQHFVAGDFFSFFERVADQTAFDVVIGNPPFIRFQHFDPGVRENAFRLLRRYGYAPNGLANAWCSFVQLTAELICEGGRLAMVLPAELLQVGYAAELRARLPRMFESVTVVAFDRLVFPDIQQEVVLLLAEGRLPALGSGATLHLAEVASAAELDSLALNGSDGCPRSLLKEEKWTSLFLEGTDLALISSLRLAVSPLGRYAEVDVGIVTGRNRFFVMTKHNAQMWELDDYCVDVVGRTNAFRSYVFDQGQLAAFAAEQPSRLLNLKGVAEHQLPLAVKRYIASGEAEGVHRGYKCGIRPRWFDVPSIYTPDGFMFRQVHQAPLLIANRAGATSTDTVHRVRVTGSVPIDRLALSFINSLSFVASELGGRSYGGGVLELEPREAELLPLPVEYGADIDADYVDRALRQGELEKALRHTDEIVLRRGLGLDTGDVNRLRSAWRKLRDRRQRRSSRDIPDQLAAAE